MSDFIPEKFIEKSPNPISIEGMDKILFQMKNSICRIIKNDGNKGTGFFCRIPYNNNLLPVLITNNHVLNNDDIQNDKKIEFTINDGKIIKNINIDNSRKKFTNKELDVTFIEINPKKDKIDYFLDVDDSINTDLENIYNNESIYVIHYPKRNYANVSFGLSKMIKDNDINHLCSTEEGSSGAPILFLDSFKVIGIHKGAPRHSNSQFNIGCFIKNPIDIFNQNNQNINKKEKNINNEIHNNQQVNNLTMNNISQNYGNNQINYINNNTLNYNNMNRINIMNNMNNIMNYNNNENSTMIRLTKEFKLCKEDNDLIQIGCNFSLEDNNNFYTWRVTMLGPRDTPYEGGLFTIIIIFPHDYPGRGPEFKFKNKIYHLHVDQTSHDFGHISLNYLNEWRTTGRVSNKPCYSVKTALFDIFCLFYYQDVYDFYDYKMADEFKNNREEFNKKAAKWTKLYAPI